MASVKDKDINEGSPFCPSLDRLKLDNHGKDLAEESRKQMIASGLRKDLKSVAEVNSAVKTRPNFSVFSSF